MEIGGRTLTLTNLDKVLYPETGTTKRDVIDYYESIAAWMIPHIKDRPVTRKRWADGVDGPVFFEKNLPKGAPEWVPRETIHHEHHDNEYPLVDDLPTLVWLAQQAALELHVPQWRFGAGGEPQNPDRLVLDLDPGPGVGLRECAEVARAAREILRGMALEPVPVTSGSKGIHLYAALDGVASTRQVSDVAHELAKALEQDMPALVLSTMSRAERAGKVFVDWSQNNGNKTTIAPYSLRGKAEPTVAAPRTWEELEDPKLHHLTWSEVLERVREHGDLLHQVAAAALSVGRPDHGRWESNHGQTTAAMNDEPQANDDRPANDDRLATYRSMRDPEQTPEPVPAASPTVREDGAPTFLIQEHHATRNHYDFRLEHDGVLVSWALPKGEPTDPSANHLAVHTEDHPLEYGGFEGIIPEGQYGGGTVTIWDDGTYECEKWRDDKEIIVTLHGRTHGVRRLALLHTGGRGGNSAKNWLIHRTKEQPTDEQPSAAQAADTDGALDAKSGRKRDTTPSSTATASAPLSEREPMLATLAHGRPLLDAADWAFEMKWDGIRALAEVSDRGVRLLSRNGNDLTNQYPELQAIAEHVAVDAIVDGEIVALDTHGRPSFGLLQGRMGLTRPRDIESARRRAPVRFVAFDILTADDHELTRLSYVHRREALQTVVTPGDPVDVPPAFDGSLSDALAESRRRGLEGVVAKRRTSRYAEGRRSDAWLKWKLHATQEVIVGGWRPGAGRRAGGIGALLLGVPGPDGLQYVGKVGTGFSDSDLDEIERLLHPLARKTPPFADELPRADAADARWVTPRLVGEVEFSEWTSGGRLRHPSWRGWRPDKPPDSVVREGTEQ